MFRYYCALYKLIFLLLGFFGLCLFTQLGGLIGIILLIICIMALVAFLAGAVDGSQKKDPLQVQANNLVVIFNQTLDEIDSLQKQFKDANPEQLGALYAKKHQLYKKLCGLREDANILERECFVRNMELPVGVRRHSIYKSVEDKIRWELKRKIQEAIDLVLSL